jgi:hypothetical protein
MKALLFCLAMIFWLIGCPLPTEGPAAKNAGKALTAFSIESPAVMGDIDQGAGTISVHVPFGALVTSLVALFTTSGTSVTVDGIAQVSGETANDFTAPVTYTVSAEDGSTAAYVVTVSVAAAPRADKAITSFWILKPEASGQIDEDSKTIAVMVPHGTDLSSLVAAFSTTGICVSVDDTEQTSGVTINDFTEPLLYAVSAEDGSTAAYRVSVTPAPGSEKALTAFTIQGLEAAAAIDAQTRVIRVRLPPGTDLGSLVAVFTTTGTSVLVNGQEQKSGITVNDFTRGLDYVVRAEDGSMASWSVRVVAGIGLLINELDVDQVGTDYAEFIELYASEEVDLGGIIVALVNGGESPGREYARIDLSSAGTLAAGSYLVAAGSRVGVAPGSRKITPAGWESSNRIQNGPNDAVLLFDTIGRRVIDTLSYDGVLHQAMLAGESTEVDATEGSTGAPADSNTNTGSIGRNPSGRDTGQNGADFRFSPTMTPGAANN